MIYHLLPSRTGNLRKLGNSKYYGDVSKGKHVLLKGGLLMKLGIQIYNYSAISLSGYIWQRKIPTNNVLNGTVYSIRGIGAT